jgi:PAS domain S-box-containing protein
MRKPLETPKRDRVRKAAAPGFNGGRPASASASTPNGARRRLSRHAEPQFRGIFDHALSIMAVLHPDGRVAELNRTALAFHQAAASELVGRKLWVAPRFKDDPQAVRELRKAVAAAGGGKVVRLELTLTDSAGEEKCLDLSLTPVRNEREQIARLLLEARDISARKQAERALDDSRRSLQRALTALERAHSELEDRVRKKRRSGRCWIPPSMPSSPSVNAA